MFFSPKATLTLTKYQMKWIRANKRKFHYPYQQRVAYVLQGKNIHIFEAKVGWQNLHDYGRRGISPIKFGDIV